MGMIPSRREDRGLTPLRLRAWISVSAAAKWLILKEGDRRDEALRRYVRLGPWEPPKGGFRV